MATLMSLMVKLGLDAGEYLKGLDDADKKAKEKSSSIGSSLMNAGSKMAKIGGVITAGVTAPIVAMGVKAIMSASDTVESINKVRVVFGDAADEVVTFTDSAATSLGMSQNEALGAVGTFGNLFVSMGMGSDVAADMSTSLVTMAADLASFNNIDPTEALDRLRAGLVGETEPMRRLGVNLSAVAVEAKAVEMGLVKASVDAVAFRGATMDLRNAQGELLQVTKRYGADSDQAAEKIQKIAEIEQRLATITEGKIPVLTAAQKAQATYQLYLEQTATASGDFRETSDQLANSMRIVKAQFADTVSIMGQELLPIALQVVTAVKDLFTGFSSLSPEAKKTILILAGVAAAVGPALVVIGSLLGAVGAVITFFTGPAAAAVGAAIAGILPVIGVIALVIGALVLLYMAWKNNWGGIRDFLTELWTNTLQPALQTLWNWLQVNIPAALAALAGYWSGVLLPAIMQVWAFIQEYVLPVFRAIGQVLGATWDYIVRAAAALWTNILLPALQEAMEWISANVQPVLKSIGDYIEKNFMPVIEKVAGFVGGALNGAFEGLKNILRDVASWLATLAGTISRLKLPAWLTPGSPTPFEIGLRGIRDELKKIDKQTMPGFKAELDMQPSPFLKAVLSGAVGNEAGGSSNVYRFYAPVLFPGNPGQEVRSADVLRSAGK